MSDLIKDRLSYFLLLREALKKDLHNDKWLKRLFPWVFLILGAISGILVYIVPPEIFSDEEKRIWIITIYSAFLTAQGILFAVCLFAFSTILNKMSEPLVNRILKNLKLDIYYLFLIQHIAIFQMLSLVAQVVGLLLSLKINSVFWLKFLFFVALWSFSYAAKWSFGMVTLIRDLLWYTSKALEKQSNSYQKKIISLNNKF